jgi:hypothetical protein
MWSRLALSLGTFLERPNGIESQWRRRNIVDDAIDSTSVIRRETPITKESLRREIIWNIECKKCANYSHHRIHWIVHHWWRRRPLVECAQHLASSSGKSRGSKPGPPVSLSLAKTDCRRPALDHIIAAENFLRAKLLESNAPKFKFEHFSHILNQCSCLVRPKFTRVGIIIKNLRN